MLHARWGKGRGCGERVCVCVCVRGGDCRNRYEKGLLKSIRVYLEAKRRGLMMNYRLKSGTKLNFNHRCLFTSFQPEPFSKKE